MDDKRAMQADTEGDLRDDRHGSRQSVVQQDTASSRTLSGPTVPLAEVQSPFTRGANTGTYEAATHPEDNYHTTSHQRKRPRRTPSDESRILMPPPPVPTKRSRLDEQAGHTAPADDVSDVNIDQELAKTSSAFLQSQGRILLNENGTWERLKEDSRVDIDQRTSHRVEIMQPFATPSQRGRRAQENHGHETYANHRPQSHKVTPQHNVHTSPERTASRAGEFAVSG